ncbi:transposase [Pseudomonas cichorii]|uniref:transposase n=1 Tax=Pseudomonas cichorii TaxID=36746 RepID=UPI00191082A7|nr:transposase [Pseudomonas cichorii]
MRQRSSYSKLFKAQVVQECLQPGATISSVAIHPPHDWRLLSVDSGQSRLAAIHRSRPSHL